MLSRILRKQQGRVWTRAPAFRKNLQSPGLRVPTGLSGGIRLFAGALTGFTPHATIALMNWVAVGLNIKEHGTTGIRYWTLVAGGAEESWQPTGPMPANPRRTRVITFVDEKYTGQRQSYRKTISDIWWNQHMAGSGVSWAAFCSSRVTTFSTTLGITAGLLPRP